MSCWNWAILQIYFCTLNMKYNLSILLEIFWFPKFVTLKNDWNLHVSSILFVHQEFSNNYTLSILWTCFLNAFVFLFWVRNILWSRISKLTNLHTKIEVYLKYNWCILFKTQRYTWGGLSKVMYLIYPNSEVCFK